MLGRAKLISLITLNSSGPKFNLVLIIIIISLSIKLIIVYIKSRKTQSHNIKYCYRFSRKYLLSVNMWVEKHNRGTTSSTYCKGLRETQILLQALKKVWILFKLKFRYKTRIRASSYFGENLDVFRTKIRATRTFFRPYSYLMFVISTYFIKICTFFQFKDITFYIRLENLSVFPISQYDILELKRHENYENRLTTAILAMTLALSGCACANNKEKKDEKAVNKD